jgi:hypothetical protein
MFAKYIIEILRNQQKRKEISLNARRLVNKKYGTRVIEKDFLTSLNNAIL